MRLLVVGAGSTGGYFGGRLAEAGRDVTFLVRPERAARLGETGLRIVSPRGDVTVHPKLITARDIREPFDTILLTVKTFQLQDALDDIAWAVGPNTMILPVLNGMSHTDVLADRFGLERVVGCALKVATTLDDEGRIVQLNTLQDLAYGELDGKITTRIQALDEFMKGAEIGARLSGAIRREMWEKWILLATTGAITCLMRGTIGEIVACPEGSIFSESLLEEVVAIVRTVGEPPSETFLKSVRELLTAQGSRGAASMYRDLVEGRPIEAEAIVSDLFHRGVNAGLNAPLLLAAHTNLAV